MWVAVEETVGDGQGEDPDQLRAHGRLEHPLLEILLPAREVGRVLGRHALKPGQNVPRDDDAVHRVGMNVRIAVLVNVTFGTAQRGGHLEQVDPGVGGDVTGAALRDLAIARAIEERRHPELEIESVVTNMSASRSTATKLGLGCTKWGSSSPCAIEVTLPLSPTISRAMAPYVVRLVTILIGAAGPGPPSNAERARSE